jgi:sterol desaturase/sphingolipid hydroxylase (fatty acid hydroxylase superfamily)
MIYAVWLFGFSLLFIVLERFSPQRESPLLRREWKQDLFYIVFNGEYLGLLIGLAAIRITPYLDPYVSLRLLGGVPLFWQTAILIVVFDFLQWGIHNLLHRVPWLWEFHKLHHSIQQMDWIGNWRFHCAEVIVYRSLLYVPSALLGFSGEAMFIQGLVNTFAGHFAHSNTSFRLGPINYVVNGPEMHRWHHVHPDAGPPDRNFGIVFSIWDWLFGTAYLPPGPGPSRYGFDGIEHYPRGIVGRFVAPFRPAGASK